MRVEITNISKEHLRFLGLAYKFERLDKNTVDFEIPDEDVDQVEDFCEENNLDHRWV